MPESNEFIIKMPDEDPVPEHGVGYEIFHKMTQRAHDTSVCQIIARLDESVTYSELLEDSIRLAINLKKYNFPQDAIIATCSWSGKQTWIPYIAGLFNGNIVTYLDSEVSPRVKSKILQKVTPAIIFVDEESLPNIEESLRIAGLKIKLVVFGKNVSGNAIPFEELLIASKHEINGFEPVKLENNESTAAIVFTSGTTGVPKGVCISHLAILARTGGFSAGVCMTLSSPVWISYSMSLIRVLREGGTMVLAERCDFSQIWNIVDKYKVNSLVPTAYQCSQIVKQPITSDLDVSSLGLMSVSGSVMHPDTHSRLKEILPNVVVLQTYGLTEACGILLVFDMGIAEERELYFKKERSCGTPVPGVWYKVVDIDTEEILGPNKSGELRVKSRYSSIGSFNEDSSEDIDSDGYLKTGDLVYYDEDRCFYVVGRLKEKFRYRGIWWNPTEFENVLMLHPFVEIAVVIPVPHKEDISHPVGVVKLKKNETVKSEELTDYVNKEFSDDVKKLWGGVKIINDFPTTGSGKIHKQKLLEMIRDEEI